MAQIPVIPISPPTAIVPVGAAAGGDQYYNDGAHLLFVFNDGVAPVAITRVAQTQPESPDTCPNDVVTCAATSLTILPPLAPRRFNDATGNVHVTYPGGTSGDIRVVVIFAPLAR